MIDRWYGCWRNRDRISCRPLWRNLQRTRALKNVHASNDHPRTAETWSLSDNVKKLHKWRGIVVSVYGRCNCTFPSREGIISCMRKRPIGRDALNGSPIVPISASSRIVPIDSVRSRRDDDDTGRMCVRTSGSPSTRTCQRRMGDGVKIK
jgi:hypothetical protein